LTGRRERPIDISEDIVKLEVGCGLVVDEPRPWPRAGISEVAFFDAVVTHYGRL
jgi:hypothetical protein